MNLLTTIARMQPSVACIRLADGGNTMPQLHTMKAFGRGMMRFVAALALVSAAAAADPDPLPRPRAKPEPQKLVLPDAEPDAATTKPSAANQAEIPKPDGRPGRAPEPPGDATEATAKPGAKEGKKKDPPPPDGRCDQCGGCDCVRKVCVPKMTEKEIKKVCWDAKCEDFCIPGPSVWCGKACKTDDCGCWTHHLWKPTCAEVKTRVVPVRKETKRKVPAVEWKVEERCACCRRKPCDIAAKPAPAAPSTATENPAAEGRK